MNITHEERAQVLIQALPYIKEYTNKVVVIKYGGNAMIDPKLTADVMSDLVLLSLVGVKVVLVHGGGPDVSSVMMRMGKTPRFVDGLRQTDAETAEIAQMVLAGKTNKDLVKLLQSCGGKAIGLCGIDGGMLQAEKLKGEVDLGFVGDVKCVNIQPVRDVLDAGYIPVIATVGVDEQMNTYNINADTAAAAIAAALKAENIILMTDVRGLLENPEDENTLIPVVNVSDVPHLIHKGIIKGGMIPKCRCCVEAVRRGVQKAFIIDGRIQHSILIEMLSDKGVGTMFI